MSEAGGQVREEDEEGDDDDACQEERTWERSRGSGSEMNQSKGNGATYLSALLLPQRRDGGERHTYRLCGARYSSCWPQDWSSCDSQVEHAS